MSDLEVAKAAKAAVTTTEAVDDNAVQRGGEGAQTARHLEHVTDYVEDAQIDVSKAVNLISSLATDVNDAKIAKAKREKELRAVKVKDDDVKLVAREMEISEERADRVLRENAGDAVAALQSLISERP